MLPLVHWYQAVVMDACFQQLLELGDLEMNQQRRGWIPRSLSCRPGMEQLESLAEWASHFQRHPEATPEEALSPCGAVHVSGECKKTASC